MTTFQLFTLPVLIAFLIITAVATSRRKLTPRLGAAWVLLWLAAAFAIAVPESLVQLARFLGIGRGADLVFYVSILAGFFAFFLIYLRFRRIEDQLTQIVRHLAILKADREDKPPGTSVQ